MVPLSPDGGVTAQVGPGGATGQPAPWPRLLAGRGRVGHAGRDQTCRRPGTSPLWRARSTRRPRGRAEPRRRGACAASGRLREGARSYAKDSGRYKVANCTQARSYAKRFAVPDGSAPGQRYSPGQVDVLPAERRNVGQEFASGAARGRERRGRRSQTATRRLGRPRREARPSGTSSSMPDRSPGSRLVGTLSWQGGPPTSRGPGVWRPCAGRFGQGLGWSRHASYSACRVRSRPVAPGPRRKC